MSFEDVGFRGRKASRVSGLYLCRHWFRCSSGTATAFTSAISTDIHGSTATTNGTAVTENGNVASINRTTASGISRARSNRGSRGKLEAARVK
eukprot:2499658-Rhodomonas_salina.3